MIRRYIIWRNNHAYDERLRRIHLLRKLLPRAPGMDRDHVTDHRWTSVIKYKT